MNVTLTFSVFFGPLAIGLLVGCGPMKNYEFSQINEKIEWDQYKLHQLQSNLTEVIAERDRLGEFLNYTHSPAGLKYYASEQCRQPVPARLASTPKSVDKCSLHVGQSDPSSCRNTGTCDEVAGTFDSNMQPVLSNVSRSGGCTASNRQASAADHSDGLVTAIAGALCVAGPGKLPLWARIPSPGKVIVEGAMRLTRSFACARTVNRLSPIIDKDPGCLAKRPSNCREQFARTSNDDTEQLQSVQQQPTDIDTELKRCESITSRFQGLNRFSAQDKWNELKERVTTIVSDIEVTQNAIRNAEAQKVSVDTKYKAYQEYTPSDPG